MSNSSECRSMVMFEPICSQIESMGSQRRASEMVRRTLCGVIECATANCPLNSDDVLVITLCDTTLFDWSRIDFPHIPTRCIISSVKLDDCGYFPVPFTLYYNDEQIDINLCYGVRCDVIDREQNIKYSSERFVPVLTDKQPKTNINIMVSPRQIPCGSSSHSQWMRRRTFFRFQFKKRCVSKFESFSFSFHAALRLFLSLNRCFK